jgi:hypothetical protein
VRGNETTSKQRGRCRTRLSARECNAVGPREYKQVGLAAVDADGGRLQVPTRVRGGGLELIHALVRRIRIRASERRVGRAAVLTVVADVLVMPQIDRRRLMARERHERGRRRGRRDDERRVRGDGRDRLEANEVDRGRDLAHALLVTVRATDSARVCGALVLLKTSDAMNVGWIAEVAIRYDGIRKLEVRSTAAASQKSAIPNDEREVKKTASLRIFEAVNCREILDRFEVLF